MPNVCLSRAGSRSTPSISSTPSRSSTGLSLSSAPRSRARSCALVPSTSTAGRMVSKSRSRSSALRQTTSCTSWSGLRASSTTPRRAGRAAWRPACANERAVRPRGHTQLARLAGVPAGRGAFPCGLREHRQDHLQEALPHLRSHLSLPPRQVPAAWGRGPLEYVLQALHLFHARLPARRPEGARTAPGSDALTRCTLAPCATLGALAESLFRATGCRRLRALPS